MVGTSGRRPSTAGAGVNLTGNGKKDKIRYRTRFRLDPDEKGIDLAQPLYVDAYGEWTKKGGIGVIEPDKPLESDAALGRRALSDADEGEARRRVSLHSRERRSDFPNFYASNAKLDAGAQITDANPQQKDFLWSKGVQVIDYTSDKGDKLQGALYLPANYEPGKSVSDDHVHLREAVAGRRTRIAQPDVQRLQHLGVHQQRLRGADAGYRL